MILAKDIQKKFLVSQTFPTRSSRENIGAVGSCVLIYDDMCAMRNTSMKTYQHKRLESLEDLLTDKLRNAICTISVIAERAKMTNDNSRLSTIQALVEDIHTMTIEAVQIVEFFRELYETDK